MGKLVIGSTAMEHWFPEFREPQDLDLLTDEHVPLGDVFWHETLREWIPEDRNDIATPDELYTLKVSHSYWEIRNAAPGNWDKHMSDVVFLKHKGAKLDLDLHKVLYKIWEELHGKKKVNLQKEDTEFFKDAVVRIYDHDSIHYSVAYGEVPLYVETLVPGTTVAVNMDYIKAMPFEKQIMMYREEVYATALERLMIPNNYRFSPRRAYAWALRRTITSLTKGWSARFLVENYDIMRTPDIDYVAVHKSKAHKLILLDPDAKGGMM